ncbi:MAG TPA: ABC transporter permease subunit [Feifaniaceae bacterium]|nr:ABC transporter permease subunit [Feifaniaceae bacterium]
MKKTSGGGALVIVLICAYLLIPLAFTFLYSIFSAWNEVLPSGLTFRYYLEVFSDAAFLLSVGRTLLISAASVAACTVIVLLCMFVITAYHPEWDKYIQVLCTIPYAIQGVIIAISVLSLYAGAPAPLNNRILMMTATYCVVILPYMYQGIRNSLQAVNARCLMEAAQILGASRFAAFFRVIVPNIVSGITVSCMLSLAIVFGDFVVANTLGGNYYQTAQMYLYRAQFRSGQLSSAIVMVLFLVTLIISGAVFFTKKRNAPQEEKS